jgi:hypothetical protein
VQLRQGGCIATRAHRPLCAARGRSRDRIGGSRRQAEGGADLTPYYPDLQTVVPLQLQLVNQQQRDELRFSNGIANTGGGPWALRPEPPPAQATTTTTAVQEIRDSAAPDRCGTQPKPSDPCYHVLKENVAGTFVFQPAHNHWHIGQVALFEIRQGSPTGPIVTNNTAWVKFRLYRDSSGNRKVEVTDHSQCDSAGLCGVGAPNR